ncbi:hypothetical protein PhCBS80983_g03687 [Powellomyces hirtus]|uniref:SAM-dependent MTase RsmB/NOP-type domain-containing protein n=1 Tax=Powellomyces hirtus TaxID=109895 RepID=A0A507E1N9_9FUNG|nr:hypothetical protein PhCBS80983_g03687 [Powellomyces hirtus]
MSAIARARASLSPLFDHLSSFLTPTELHQLAHAYTAPRNTTFRLNTLKLARQGVSRNKTSTSPEKAEVLAKIQAALNETKKRPTPRVRACPWSPNAFKVSHPGIAVRHLAGLGVHKEGKIHFQSWSSILAPLCLGAQPGWRVLDMCAAPGGKSMMLVEDILGKGLIVCNELDPARAKRLQKNVDTLLPASMKDLVHVQVSDGRKLSADRELFGGQLFDAILLDAPCSGEGIIAMSVPASYKHWSLAWVQRHARLQGQLIAASHPLLKKGGYLTYSTCTLSVEENELVVHEFLKRHPDMEVVELAMPLFSEPDWSSRVSSFGTGFSNHLGTRFIDDMSKALRVFPTEEYEGFFVIRMRKRM